MEESMHVGEQETSLQDQSYHTIRRKIVYLTTSRAKSWAQATCDDLDMGRTPVREALVRLAQEGLVRTVPQSGTYVSPINLTLAESACYIREHLEKQVIVECCARATSAGIEQLDRAIVLQEKAMAEEDRIGFFLSDNLMHRMIFSIACRSTVWSWLEETNADLERFRWLRAATQVLDNQDIVNEHKQIRRAIAVATPSKRALVSKHLHMMFRNQTEVLDQFPEYFETSSSANLPKRDRFILAGFIWSNAKRLGSVLMRSRALVARTAEPTTLP